jgi:hypothetical protein
MKYMTELEENREVFEKAVKSNTHGSGLNYDYNFKWKGNILTVDTHYQLMNEAGYYVGSTPVKIKIDSARPEVISIRCRNTGKNCYGLRDELYDTFECGLIALTEGA